MSRYAVIVSLFVLAGCSAGAHPPNAGPGGVPDPRGHQDLRPTSAPPRGPASTAPPPAWVHYSGGSRWLAFGSYCWSAGRHGVCADMIGPGMRKDIPTLFLEPGEMVRFHLAFTAGSIDIRPGNGGKSVLHGRNRAVVAWRAPELSGRQLVTLDVNARAAGGSASFLARVQVR